MRLQYRAARRREHQYVDLDRYRDYGERKLRYLERSDGYRYSRQRTRYLFELGRAFENYKDGDYRLRDDAGIDSEYFNLVIERVGRY